MFALGVQEGTCTLIGNCIGANNIPLAKRFYTLIAKIAAASTLTLSLLTFFCRRQIVSAFTNDQEVKDMVTVVFIIVAAMYLFDGG